MIGRRGFVVGSVAVVVGACSGRLRQPDAVSPVAPMSERAAPSSTPAPVPSSTPSSSPTTGAPEPPPPPATPMVVTLLCRDAWDAAPARPTDDTHVPTRITIHHTAARFEDDTRAPARWRSYQAFHQQQGWSDVAYHVGADRRGHLYELRDPSVPGDTFTDYDPAGHHLIVADGDFDAQDPSPEQVEAVAQAAAAAATRLGLDADAIGGHRDHASTSCPGEALYAALPAIRQRVAELLAAGGADAVVLCGPEADARVAAIETGA